MATDSQIGTLPSVEGKAEIVVRELPPAEFPLLLASPLFQHFGLPDLTHTRAIVAQEAGSGKLVAYWLIFDAVHVEPLWIAEEHRKRPGLARRQWKGVQDVLVETGTPTAYAMIAENDMAANLPQATRLGFRKVPGQLFFIDVKGNQPEEQELENLLKKMQAAIKGDGPPAAPPAPRGD
jgi:hypothetical protein